MHDNKCLQSNILIDDGGSPVLADFGLSKMLENLNGEQFTQSRGVSESFRWFAPEVCNPPYTTSRASDIFSYAMTVLEVGSPSYRMKSSHLTSYVVVDYDQSTTLFAHQERH